MKLRTTISLYACQGTMFRGVPIQGFDSADEEEIRAMMSRIPPELLKDVKLIRSAPELQPKHGRYVPETKTVYVNPHTFKLRTRFGKGPGWIGHDELVVLHEIGHSVYDNLPEEKRQEWQNISGWMVGTKPGQAPAYVEKRPGWPPFTAKKTHKLNVEFPRIYSEKSDDEDFADCFAFFVMGKPFQLGKPKRAFMQGLFNERVRNYPQTATFGPDTPYGKKHGS